MRRLGVLIAMVPAGVVWLASAAVAKGPGMPVTGASDRATLIVGLIFAVGFGLVAMRLSRS